MKRFLGSHRIVWPIAGVLAALAWGTGLQAATDSFDSYTAGASLIGSGNGQVSYVAGMPGGNPPGPLTTLTAEVDATAQSAPNVCQFSDTDNAGGSVTFQLAPGSAVDLSAAGSAARIEFDFKTTGGPGGRVSMAWRPLYSINSVGTSQDYINNNHLAGIGDGGAWFLGGGTVLGDPNRYAAAVWYHVILITTQKGGYYFYTLELQQVGGSTLGRIGYGSAANTPDANRPFFTGFGVSLSSNTGEIVLLDNFSVTGIAAVRPAGVAWATDRFDTYGGAGTNILGLNNGQFEWINGSSLGSPVTTGSVLVNTSDFVSAPASLQFSDDILAGSFKARLPLPADALYVAAGEPIRIEMDFKAAAGPGGLVSTAMAAQYSYDAYGTGEDYLSADHVFGLADNGNWFLGSGSPMGPSLYQPATWYHLDLVVDRDNSVAGAPYSHELTVTDRGTSTSLGTISKTGLGTGSGRAFLTSLAFVGSSNPGEVTLIDNLQVKQLVPQPGPGVVAAEDTFDTYGAGTSILGQTNGQISWVNGAAGASPITAGSAKTGNTDVQSPPNSLVFTDPLAAGSFFGQIPPNLAIELKPDRKVRFRCDFKVTSGWTGSAYGPGGRASLNLRLFYSLNANGLSQDWLDVPHLFGISDNGLWWVNGAGGNGLISTVGGARYQANTWYRMDVIVERPYNGQETYRMELIDLAAGSSLGVVSVAGLNDYNRPWLTGIGFYGSSNEAEVILIDNVAFEVIDPAPPGPCPQQPFADVNRNGVVNNDDFAVFVGCAMGPGVAYPGSTAACECFDRNADGDVDEEDFAAFQRCWSGTLAANPACAE